MLGCGLLHDEQQMGRGGAVVVGADVVDDLPSCLSSIFRLITACSSPSFAALVHHSRANAFD